MKIVVKYTNSDGCTYACDVVIPIERASIEEAYCEWLEASKKSNFFEVFGAEFNINDWPDGSHPEFLSVEEWFVREAQ